MIVSIAAPCSNQRIFAPANAVIGVSPAIFSTESVRRRRRACRVLAATSLRKYSLHTLRVIQPAISLTASRLLLDLKRRRSLSPREHRMRRFQLNFGPSYLAFIVLVDFACMTLLVLLSL
jgi:hypothetical protein